MWWGDIKSLNIWKDDPKKKEAENEITLLEELDLSVRSLNCLKRNHCETVSDLIQLINEDRLKIIRGLGANSITEVMGKVQPYM